MNIRELIRLLELYPPETDAMAYNPDFHFATPVTGALYDESLQTLELTTDD